MEQNLPYAPTSGDLTNTLEEEQRKREQMKTSGQNPGVSSVSAPATPQKIDSAGLLTSDIKPYNPNDSFVKKLFQTWDAGAATVGQGALNAITGLTGDLETGPDGKLTTGSQIKSGIAGGIRGIIGSGPEIAASSVAGIPGKAAKFASPLLLAGTGYAHDKSRGGDELSALTNAGSLVLGSLAGDAVGQKLLAPVVKSEAGKKVLGEWLGQTIMGSGADVFAHREDKAENEDLSVRVSKNIDDALTVESLTARLLADAGFGAAGYVKHIGQIKDHARSIKLENDAINGPLAKEYSDNFLKTMGIDVDNTTDAKTQTAQSFWNDYKGKMEIESKKLDLAPKDALTGRPTAEQYEQISKARDAHKQKLIDDLATLQGIPMTVEEAADHAMRISNQYYADSPDTRTAQKAEQETNAAPATPEPPDASVARASAASTGASEASGSVTAQAATTAHMPRSGAEGETMVTAKGLKLFKDPETGLWHDEGGMFRNEAGQRVDAKGEVIKTPMGRKIKAAPAEDTWYHGTRKEIESSDPGTGGSRSVFGDGLYLTNDKKYAEYYASNEWKNKEGAANRTLTADVKTKDLMPESVIQNPEFKSLLASHIDAVAKPLGEMTKRQLAAIETMKNPKSFDDFKAASDILAWDRGFLNAYGKAAQDFGYKGYLVDGEIAVIPSPKGRVSLTAPDGRVIKSGKPFLDAALAKAKSATIVDGQRMTNQIEHVSTADFHKDYLRDNDSISVFSRFLKSLKVKPDTIKVNNGDVTYDAMAPGHYDEKAHEVHVALENGDAKRLVSTLSEELAHYTTGDYMKRNPAGYKMVEEAVMKLTPDQRAQILEDFASGLGYKLPADFNLDYYAGRGNSPYDGQPYDAMHNTFEFIGAIQRIATDASLAGVKPKLNSSISKLPYPIARLVSKAIKAVNGMLFGSDKAGGVWDDSTKKALHKVFDHMQNEMVKFDVADVAARNMFDKLGIFEPSEFGKLTRTPSVELENAYSPDKFRSAPSAKVNDALKETAKQLSVMKETVPGQELNFFEKYFMTPLQKSIVYPEIRPLLDHLFSYNGKVKGSLEEVFAAVGGMGVDGKSQAEALKTFNDDRLHYLSNPKEAIQFSKAVAEDQRRRDSEDFTNDKLVSKKELMEKFHMSEAAADRAMRWKSMTDKVAKMASVKIQERNKVEFAVEIAGRIPGISKDQAKQVAGLFLLPSNQLGILEYKKREAQYKLSQIPASDVDKRKSLQGYITAQETQMESLAKSIVDPLLKAGMDPTNAKVAAEALYAKMVFFGYDAIAWANITQKQGYAPQIRNGKYIAIAVDPDGTKQTFDHNDRAKVDKWVEENQKEGRAIKVYDKPTFEKKFQFLHVDDVERLRTEQNENLKMLIERMQKQLMLEPGSDLAIKSLQELSTYYDSPDQDYQNIRSIKGNPFVLKRENIKGFNEGDYLANILNYSKFRTAKSERDLVKANVKLERTDKFYAANPELARDVDDHKNFVLSAQNSDFAKFRNFLNLWFVGGSIKQLAQNGFQQFQNGYPMLVRSLSVKHGNRALDKAAVMQTKAFGLASRWSVTGSTGDPVLDHMLAYAKKEGRTTPAAIEAEFPESNIQGFVEFAKLGEYLRDGSVSPMENVKLKGVQAMQQGMHYLRQTAAIGEMANRNISFVTGVLAAKDLGITEPRKIYDFAARYTDDVNFIGDKSNRPKFVEDVGRTWAYGPVNTAMALKSFTLNHLGQMVALGKGQKDFGRWDPVSESRIKGKGNDKTAVATSVLAIAAFAGASGLLAASDIDELMKAMFGKGWEEYINDKARSVAKWADLDEETGGHVADVISRGIPYGLFGTDTSSAGMGNILNIREGNSLGDNMTGAVGVAPSFMANLGKAASFAADGEYRAAASVGAPTAIKQMVRLHDIINYGAPRNLFGDVTVLQNMKPLEQVGSAAGFPSRTQTKLREANQRMAREEKNFQDSMNSEQRKLGKALASGDEKTLQAEARRVIDTAKKRGDYDPTNLVRGVADEYLKTRMATLRESTSSNFRAMRPAEKSLDLPKGLSPYRSKTQELIYQILTAKKLGLPEVASKLADSAELRQKDFADKLAQSGLSSGEILYLKKLLGE